MGHALGRREYLCLGHWVHRFSGIPRKTAAAEDWEHLKPFNYRGGNNKYWSDAMKGLLVWISCSAARPDVRSNWTGFTAAEEPPVAFCWTEMLNLCWCDKFIMFIKLHAWRRKLQDETRYNQFPMTLHTTYFYIMSIDRVLWLRPAPLRRPWIVL